MKTLSEPSQALAIRILDEVGFEDRLIGYRFRERSGMMPVTLYSFEEVVALLMDSNPRIDFSRLENWLRKPVKDYELAERVKQVADQDISDQEKSELIRNLMIKRLLQCKKNIPQV